MKSNLKKILIFTMALFMMSTSAIAVEESVVEDVLISQTVQNTQNTTADNVANTVTVKTPQTQLEPNDVQNKKPKSWVNIIFKFILALLWVAISSVVIFIILVSYKKLILKNKTILPTYESTEKSLNTPRNFKEALKLFLDKTKWD